MCGRKVLESKLEQRYKHSEAGQNGKGKELRSNLAEVVEGLMISFDVDTVLEE